MLGDRASVADFAFIGPFYAHFWRDPWSGALMRRIAPRLCAWVERMNAIPTQYGDFLADDAVPETLDPIFRHLFAEYWPAVVDAAGHVATRIDAHPGQPIPRTLGTHDVTIGGVRETRAVWADMQYALQRPVRFHAAQTGAARDALDTFLNRFGAREAIRVNIRRPVARVGFQMVAA